MLLQSLCISLTLSTHSFSPLLVVIPEFFQIGIDRGSRQFQGLDYVPCIPLLLRSYKREGEALVSCSAGAPAIRQSCVMEPFSWQKIYFTYNRVIQFDFNWHIFFTLFITFIFTERERERKRGFPQDLPLVWSLPTSVDVVLVVVGTVVVDHQDKVLDVQSSGCNRRRHQ